MARKSEGPRYYDSKGAYFGTFAGERVRLCDGPKSKANDKLAQERYAEEAAGRAVHKDKDRSPAWAVLNAWLTWCETRTDPAPVAPSTLEINKRFAQSLSASVGALLWRDLLPHHFDTWLATMKATAPRKGWGPGTRRLAMNTIKAACAWAKASGLVAHNPLALPGAEKLRAKKVLSRGARLAITEDEHRALVAQAARRDNKDWLCILMLWWATGARPAEVALARGEEWDAGKQGFVIEPTEANHGRFKLAHLGESRVVYVPDYLVPMVEALVRRRPTGPLFRNQEGTLYTKEVVCARVECSIEALNRQAGSAGPEIVRDGVTAYSYRHAYVTRWILAGHDPMRLCALLGTSLTMLHRHYSHLFEEHAALRDSLNDFSRGGSSAGRTANAPDDEDED